MENFDYYLAKNLYHEIDGMDGDLDTVSSFGNDIVISDPQDTFLNFYKEDSKFFHDSYERAAQYTSKEILEKYDKTDFFRKILNSAAEIYVVANNPSDLDDLREMLLEDIKKYNLEKLPDRIEEKEDGFHYKGDLEDFGKDVNFLNELIEHDNKKDVYFPDNAESFFITKKNAKLLHSGMHFKGNMVHKDDQGTFKMKFELPLNIKVDTDMDIDFDRKLVYLSDMNSSLKDAKYEGDIYNISVKTPDGVEITKTPTEVKVSGIKLEDLKPEQLKELTKFSQYHQAEIVIDTKEKKIENNKNNQKEKIKTDNYTR